MSDYQYSSSLGEFFIMTHPPRHTLYTLAVLASITASWSGYVLYREAHPPERDAPPAIRSDTDIDMADPYGEPEKNTVVQMDTEEYKQNTPLPPRPDTVTSEILLAQQTTDTDSPATAPSPAPPQYPPIEDDRQWTGDTLTLTVNDSTYVIPYTTSITAEQAMDTAVTHYREFSYRGTSYGATLGTFVYEINGTSNDTRARMYWILYHNDAVSHKGISTLILQPFDIITWKYEKEKL